MNEILVNREYETYKNIIGYVNDDIDRYLEICTADTREYKLRTGLTALSDNSCITAFKGVNDKGELLIIPLNNITSVKIGENKKMNPKTKKIYI